MKKTVIAIFALGVAYISYWVWPFVGLHKISQAVAARDPTQLAAQLDLPAIKRSLIDQIARAYLRVSGKDRGLTDFQIQVAVRVATAAVQPRVNELLTPQALVELLSEGGTGAYSTVRISTPRLESPNFANLFRVIANTERFGRDFPS